MSAYISYEQWIASYAVCVLTPVACGIVLAVVLKHLNGILNRITAKRSAINEALERALATVCVCRCMLACLLGRSHHHMTLLHNTHYAGVGRNSSSVEILVLSGAIQQQECP